ncbi:hypothetical protein [Bradyrhizobium acaciae]|uniref:hypothetical protein n=1 Tax=Bradyrhizobium acaciae TaxID=2683706 RepID=UPI001E4DECCC|nr:hypothetical protein [Bradyrhizobium acaciae]MCC8977892.1 hypothetical protein [Bradyrhizobium acaciae]
MLLLIVSIKDHANSAGLIVNALNGDVKNLTSHIRHRNVAGGSGCASSFRFRRTMSTLVPEGATYEDGSRIPAASSETSSQADALCECLTRLQISLGRIERAGISRHLHFPHQVNYQHSSLI